jgi:hypothetical protein
MGGLRRTVAARQPAGPHEIYGVLRPGVGRRTPHVTRRRLRRQARSVCEAARQGCGRSRCRLRGTFDDGLDASVPTGGAVLAAVEIFMRGLVARRPGCGETGAGLALARDRAVRDGAVGHDWPAPVRSSSKAAHTPRARTLGPACLHQKVSQTAPPDATSSTTQRTHVTSVGLAAWPTCSYPGARRLSSREVERRKEPARYCAAI